MEVASTGGEDPLLGLPVEVWFHVMAFLEAKDALPLSTVCRTWHDILFSQGSVGAPQKGRGRGGVIVQH